MDELCSVDGCDRHNQLRGWCHAHYKRWKRTGEIPTGPIAVPPPPRTEAERFWGRVDKSGGDDACWPWQGPVNWRGYGTFWYRGRNRHSHRVAISIPDDYPPSTVVVMHSCDNRPCCNPAHLRYGTVMENNHDMIAKGRAVAPPVRRRRD